MTTEQLISKFEEAIAKNQVVIDAFKVDFDKRPIIAFAWQESAFKSVVQNKVFNEYLAGLKNHGNVDVLINFANNQIKSQSLNYAASANEFQNFADREELRAEAIALKILERV